MPITDQDKAMGYGSTREPQSGGGGCRPSYTYEVAAQEWTLARERRDRANAALSEADHEAMDARAAETAAWDALLRESGRGEVPPPCAPTAPDMTTYRSRP